MGYAVYEDRAARDRGVDRWAGYGVPAVCDFADCTELIARGMGFRCEEYTTWRYATTDGEELTAEEFEDRGEASDQEIEEQQEGCGLHFCGAHSDHETHGDSVTPKPDVPEWEQHMLTDDSWAPWRAANPDRTAAMKSRQKEAA